MINEVMALRRAIAASYGLDPFVVAMYALLGNIDTALREAVEEANLHELIDLRRALDDRHLKDEIETKIYRILMERNPK